MLGEAAGRLRRARIALHRDAGGVVGQHQHEVVGQPLDPVACLHGHAQQAQDHRRGQREGEVADDIHPALTLDAVQQLVHVPLNTRSQGRHRVRGERLADDAPEPRVLRRIGEVHALADQREERVELPVSDDLLDSRGAVRGKAEVVERGEDVVVAREDPGLEGLVPVHGIGGPEPVVDGIRIGDHRRAQEVWELGRAGGRRRHGRPLRGQSMSMRSPRKGRRGSDLGIAEHRLARAAALPPTRVADKRRAPDPGVARGVVTPLPAVSLRQRGLLHPASDRLGRGFELPSQLLGARVQSSAAGTPAGMADDFAASWRPPFHPDPGVSVKLGQLQPPCSAPMPVGPGFFLTARSAAVRLARIAVRVVRGPSMPCPCCRHDNPSAAKFCIECAAPLTSCARCGTALPPGANRCPECAQPTGEQAVAPHLASPEAYTPPPASPRRS